MSLLRNNTDNSINFQRASCTLDGCVKIWTSRVDSVGTETGKLLSNLANEGRIGADDDDDENEDGEGGEGVQAKKRKTHRPASTLAKDISQLRNKKLDLEFHVDPLFRKTCADFDEGGAQGLLMNHLALGVGSDGSLRVVFDASDSVGKDDEEELEMEEPPSEVDLSNLRQQFLPNWSDLEEKAICHSLHDFSFSKDSWALDDSTTLFRNDHALEQDDDGDGDEPAGFNDDFNEAPMDMGGPAPVEDFFVGDQAVNDDYMHEAPPSPSVGGSEHGLADEAREYGADGAFVPFDPRRAPNERDLVMAMTDNEEGGMMYDYFDKGALKNWAGPEHWKLRKVVRRPDAAEAAPKKQREKKEALKINFTEESAENVKEIAKKLFAPPSRGAALTLPGPSLAKKKRGRKGKDKEKDEKRFNNTLPDDMHFSSKQLVTLFLKPKFSLRTRGQRGRLDDRPEGEVDENFWAQAAADQAAGRSGSDDLDATQDGGAIPFNTQFFHDEYDDAPGFDDAFDGDGGDIITAMPEPGEQDLLATAPFKRRVRPETVNYAKRAKRVDVRKLKDNIWKNLDIDTDDRPATDPAEPRGFENVISGLQQSYPKEKLEDISTSFCFICLLHLANERGLKLENGDSEDTIIPDDEADKKVGNLWDLKVYRDPDATPAA
ncbi:uncharacterized protein PHACADRAFT_200373 [Phanerochaete carnosa HHB-10118-sp]|uniref:Condensin complex subunit 2 n=1 Tax=Phanerochaete carnosa (strain HHB-10118-sp) TaxID=650164 RepID=K5ULA7_PHACS|nr:uncharacterized protein PHACADRAFT_200373 [Phanerochaete carnosa HHB-10118-sp]EKM50431.1 hypothetical protein PHACADRAFT_200373 [Phanerochaete carnosa HHB-10118-sp]